MAARGSPYLVAGMIGEAMAYANPAVAWSWTSHDNLCLDAIYRNGNERPAAPLRAAHVRGKADRRPRA